MLYELLHRIPGRVRVRIQKLKSDAVFAERLYSYLKSKSEFKHLHMSRDCASLVINFNEKEICPLQFLENLSDDTVLLADLPLGKESSSPGKNFFYRLASQLELRPRLQLGLGIMSLLAGFYWPAGINRVLLLLSAVPILARGVRTTYDEGRPGVDLLDGSSVILLTIERSYMPASIMVFLLGLGEFIRDFAAEKSQRMLDELLSLSHQSAWLLSADSRLRIPAERLKAGDKIVVYSGERVPAAAEVISGQATVLAPSEAHDTMPQDLAEGALVSEASVVLDGKLYLKCIAARSTPRPPDRIIERERKRLLYRTPYQRNALKNAYNIVTPMLIFAAAAFALSRNLNQSLTIICFDLLTGIRIALPTSILSYMYKAGKQGLLIKSGAALEKLSQLQVFIFARTGVLTQGQSELTELIPLTDAFTADQLMAKAAAVEHRFHHAAARAIYRACKKRNLKIPERSNSRLHAGLGVSALVENIQVSIGSASLMQQLEISLEKAGKHSEILRARGDSVVYLAFENELVALLAYKDQIRAEASESFQSIKDLGAIPLIVSSGPTDPNLDELSKQNGFEHSFANLSPEDKADLVRDYQLRGYSVAFLGDDLSDALAMAQADIAIAMSDSTELAQYRADVIITNDDLRQIPQLFALSKDAMAHIKDNMLIVSLPNWIGLFLSLFNRIGPVNGTVFNNGSVILAALHGLSPGFSSGLISIGSKNNEETDSALQT